MDDDPQESSLPSQVLTRADVAYQMRRRGMSLVDIADELHVGPKAVQDMISSRFRQLSEERTDQDKRDILDMENDRLDYYLAKLWPSIEYGDPKAITAALAIHDRKMKANQLDKPDAQVAQSTILVVGGQEEDYIAKLKELTE
jgi:orotate phosphoribosyltransferase-like protein